MTIESRTSPLWTTWLLASSAGVGLFGVWLVLFTGSGIDIITPIFYDTMAGDGAFRALGSIELRFIKWTFALFGAVMAGWGLTLVLLIRTSYRRGEPWAWRAVAMPVGVWYLLDTGASVYHGMMINVALNTVVLVAMAVPLVATLGMRRGRG